MVNLALFLPSLIDLGATASLVKYISEYKGTRKVNSLVRWFLILNALCTLALILIVFLLREQIIVFFLKDASLSYLIFPSLVVIGLVFFDMFKSIAQGFHDFKLFSLSQFLTSLSIGLLSVLLGYYFGITYAILGWAIGYFIGNLPILRFIMKKNLFEKGSELDVKRIFMKYSLPIFLITSPVLLGAGIIPILSLFFSQKLIGYYSFALTFYAGVLLIPGALTAVIFPKVSEMHGMKKFKDAKNMMKRVMLIYTPIVIFGVIGTFLLSRFVVQKVAPLFLPSLTILNVLVVFGLLNGYLLIYRSYLTASAHMKKLSLIILVQNLALFAVSFISMIL
jgi:O-antigen/teichoic acid export membrane protein